MNNKKIAIFVFALITAAILAVVGVFFTVRGSITANLFNLGSNILADSREIKPQNCGNFKDIPETSDYCRLAQKMRDGNIFSGDSTGNFRPDAPVSRAELAKILVNALYGKTVVVQDYTTLDGLQIGFSDIKNERHWSLPYIKIAKEKGLIEGFADGTFQPDRLVTRAEFAKMLYSQLPGLSEKISEAGTYVFGKWPNPSESIGLRTKQWYTDYMMLLIFADSKGAFLKDCGGNICPEKTVTRIEIAGAIERLDKE